MASKETEQKVKNADAEMVVLIREKASTEIERAVYAIDGMAKAIFTIARTEDVDVDIGLALMELAKVIESNVMAISSLTFDDKAECVEIIGNTIQSAHIDQYLEG